MIPDFPKLKRDIHKYFLMRSFENARLSDPLLARIKHYLQHEGDDGTYELWMVTKDKRLPTVRG